jgi:hypothetical protein
MTSTHPDEQETFGRLLFTYLVPQEFQRLIADDNDPLTLVLDRSTAEFPWEMASFQSTRGTISLGRDRRLTRQFRTRLSSAPGIAPKPKDRLRVLVIADPAQDRALQLPGARLEGREIVSELRKTHQSGVQVEVIDCIGWVDSRIEFVLAMILEGDFDVIHFAGHGVFDANDGSKSGWVFGDGQIISAREIFRARRVPTLVFANACFSGVVRGGEPLSASELNQANAGLAEAFFERGIQNYLGAGWPVDDTAGVQFAVSFYQQILTGAALGDAISEARRVIYEEGNTWGAYQHYGDANCCIVAQSDSSNLSANDLQKPPNAAAASRAGRSRMAKRAPKRGKAGTK